MNRLELMLAKSFAQHGERIAISSPTFSCTYDQLNEQSAGMAKSLLQAGLEANEPVLVVTENMPENLIAIVSVLVAKGVVVPIDREATNETIKAILEMTKSRFIIGHLTNIENDVCESVDADTAIFKILNKAPSDYTHLNGAALIVFTSGSTGAPKGVVMSHKGYCKKLERINSLLPFTTDDIVLIVLKLTFSFGQWTSLISLWRGCTIFLVPKFIAGDMSGFIRDRKITKFPIVPSMMRLIIQQNKNEDTLSSDEVLFMAGGEVLPEFIGRTFLKMFPNSDITDIYGLTETNSADFILMPGNYNAQAGSIGTTTPGVQYKIIKSDGQPAALGEYGDLQIKTEHIMMHYLGRPDLTEAAFNGDFFKTGDLATQKPDGTVVITGRLKDEINRGGFKIAPAEVEGVYVQHPCIKLAACIAVKDEILGEKTFLAYESDEAIDKADLVAFGMSRLDKYKVPEYFKKVDAIPLGKTGKLDRASLRSIYYNNINA